MTKKLILPIIAVAGISCSVVSCDSSDLPQYEYTQSSSVEVSAFSLTDDENVLDSLSNVYFSIDLANAKIFNADSLPYGTNVSRLIPVITAPTSASVVTLTYTTAAARDSVVDYKTTTTDSIDFSNGPVRLRVVSESASVDRVYEIKVNVHKVKPDTLAWGEISYRQAPSEFDDFDDIRVVRNGDKFYSFTSSNGRYSVATTDTPDFDVVQTASVSLPFTPRISTLCVAGGKFYMLSTGGALYISYDCKRWASTGQTWENMYGSYGNNVIGLKNNGGSHTIVTYPAAQQWPMPEGFPVSGASAPISYTLPMGYSAQMIMVGGVTADGEYTGATWGFDGENWAKISRAKYEIPDGMQGMAVIEYDLFNVPSSTWRPEEYPAILAFGGRNADGANSKVYYSRDLGITWKAAPTLLQLPAEVAPVSGASVLVYNYDVNETLVDNYWHQASVRSLPPFCLPLGSDGQPASRVDKPITSWNCPVIYMYGGQLADGSINKTVWRGAILRYTFKPTY